MIIRISDNMIILLVLPEIFLGIAILLIIQDSIGELTLIIK